MRLTFAQAKIELASQAPAEELDRRINRAVEKILLNGKFVGSMHELALNAFYGQVTPPHWYRTIEGVRVAGQVYDIVNHWWQYLQNKSSTQGFSMATLRDIEDGWANMYALPTTNGNIVVSYNGDEEIQVTIYGLDSEGFPINMQFADAGSQINTFSQINRINKEKSDVPVKVNFVETSPVLDSVFGTGITPLAWMDPDETESYYRRYIIDTLTTQPSTQIEALCKLRHIPLVEDDDVLPVHNIAGLELAMKSLQYYAEDDQVRATGYMNDAIDLFNKELGDNNASTVPTIRFHYVGGHPNMTSRY